MNKKVRKILDGLDMELTGKGPNRLDDDERRALWNVLSALRGPDTCEDERDKGAVTVPVRRAAFPRLTALITGRPGPRSYNPTGATFTSEYTESECAARRRELTDNGRWFHHFRGHGQAAFKALGLDW